MSFLGGEFKPDRGLPDPSLISGLASRRAVEIQQIAHAHGVTGDVRLVNLALKLSVETHMSFEEALRALLAAGVVAEAREVPLGRTGWPMVVIALLIAAVVTFLIIRIT